MRHRRGCSPRGGMSAWRHVCLGLGIGAALGALLGRRPWHGPKQAPAAVQSRVVTVVRRPRTTGNHTVVMGQFNTRLRSATVAAWASAWSRLRLVDDVFVAVPISTTGAPAPWTPCARPSSRRDATRDATRDGMRDVVPCGVLRVMLCVRGVVSCVVSHCFCGV